MAANFDTGFVLDSNLLAIVTVSSAKRHMCEMTALFNGSGRVKLRRYYNGGGGVLCMLVAEVFSIAAQLLCIACLSIILSGSHL